MSGTKNYITLNDANFRNEVLESTKPVLVVVDFGSNRCELCYMLPSVNQVLAAHFEGQVNLGELEIYGNALIAKQYGIRSIPTLLFFKDGKIVDHVIGVVTKKEIINKLNYLLQTGVKK